MKDIDEIEAAADRASDMVYAGSKYPGMTYEQGIRVALEWVLEIDDEDPTQP